MRDSHDRAELLVQCLQEEEDRSVKKILLRDWFNACDALGPYVEDLREQFELVGYVTDTESFLTLPATVYRGAWEDDDAELAISWTLRRDIAERFARGLTSPRGRFLGLSRDDVEAWVWEAECTAVLGYLEGREEYEVIPANLKNIRPVARLVTVGSS